jgi:hypothetical protein
MKRMMKRIGIGILFIALNAADFIFREPLHPDSKGIAVTFLFAGLYAIFCFTLLLRFVDTRKPWWFFVDAIALAILTLGVCDVISVTRHPYDSLSLIVRMSVDVALPLYVLVNVISLALVITIMWLSHKLSGKPGHHVSSPDE